ncbi:uncharacterized protein N7469_002123 [Penicillium citrinum]|uniref:Uncharacterized protein n=1 Tax=Penicillium citrinum TaxID=5077 RepID=A0A9W9TTD8_PENCI|nr:uncharacterized protein N7469_002123 [Penicillium citrinum]KAJ5240532.1 hypothetical protein N7469_002123 [Penicillium citrinum]
MGLNYTGPRLSKSDLLLNFVQHMTFDPNIRTALVSGTDRPIEALHRAFVKYYNLNERASDIWIAIISVPMSENDRLPYDHAVELALDLGYCPEEGKKFIHEYIFEWEIENRYVELIVSVDTLIDRGLDLGSYIQNGRLPDLQGFRVSITEMILGLPLDGYSVGRELGRMAKCFGARAPVEEVAHKLWTDSPTYIYVKEESLNVKWKVTESAESGEYEIFRIRDIDFEHFYWMSRGIDEVLFDSWLADGIFIEERIAHAELANNLTTEMEILWELYWDDLHFEAWNGINSGSATDKARKLQSREQGIHDQIERQAISIGL